MKILQVVHCYPPEPVGGTERVTAALVGGLAARGHEVQVLTGSLDWEIGFRVVKGEYEGTPITRIHRDDPWFDHWNHGFHPGVERIYRDLLRTFKPDVVHVNHWLRLTRNLVQVAREEGVPVVVQLHDFQATCPRTFRLKDDFSFCDEAPSTETCLACAKRWPFQGNHEVGIHLEHFQRDMVNELRAADRVLALSEIQAQCIASTLVDEVGPIEVLPPGVPVVLEPRKKREASESLRLVHWGTLYDQKGIMVLLDALALAVQKAPMELTLLGQVPDSDFRAALERRADGLPVEFHGPYDWSDLEKIEADLAVFPSYCFETYSLVVDEAVMLGLPMVLSDRGAPAERVGMGAATVPAGDGAALAAALVRLARNRDELTRLTSGVGRCWHSRDEGAARAEKIYQETRAGKSEALPPLNPLDPLERLELYWLTAGMRLLSLAGTDASKPPEWRKKGVQKGGTVT